MEKRNLILDKEKVRDRIAELNDELGRVYNILIFVTTGMIAVIIFFLTRISDLSLILQYKIPVLIQISDTGKYARLVFFLLIGLDLFYLMLITQYKRKIKRLYDLLLERKINLTINDFYKKNDDCLPISELNCHSIGR